ncbi:hypothetical protein [Parvularcula dongshanensis]|uniref:Uncharacterized protein n=1 Tax=Parvularcula dongshanensis TaxID=1173995 RepID=A0A840I0T7_9PROT|nr:hypothetical protein [Parvularcula dongshanensis]MBB4657808.1 hypothetical protein [Parvularcula dongshanensis]
MARFTIPALLLTLLLLAGCSSLRESRRRAEQANPAPCPNVFVLDDAARIIEFDGEPSLDTVAWTGEVRDVRTNCRYVEDTPISAEIEIDFALGRGPAASGYQHELQYFVAVTRTNRDLIEKSEFTLPVTFREGRATVTLTDEVDGIVIPRANADTAGTNFEIAVGFVLTRDQLLYNRSGDSLKFPEL